MSFPYRIRLAKVSTVIVVLAVALHAPALDRPLVLGCGMIWANWLDRPWSYDEQSMDRIVQMGGRATRATFDWVSLERQPGQWYWDYADHQVDIAEARNLEPFAYIGNTPGWALPAGWPANQGYRHPPDEAHAEAFINYCRAVAERYRGRVKYYFFWNEPNGCSWVNPGCANGDGYPLYTHWLKRAYDALKEGDPDCIVAAGALDYNAGVSQGWRYIQGIYDEGGGDYFDAVSIHPYASDGVHWRAIHDTRQVMVDNGDAHKPIIIGEYGWPNATTQQAAQRLTAFLTQITQPQYHYVVLCNYLCITDLPNSTNYGLCDRELNPRPIWHAFRAFAQSQATSTPIPTGPTATPTNTRTPTHTHTPSATPQPGDLLNPDFESGFEPAPGQFQDDPNYPRVRAMHWNLWGSNWWKDSGRYGDVYRSPMGAQSVGTNWGMLDNAVYQRVPVVPGALHRFSAWTMLECSAPSVGQLWRTVGIDPTGGVNPLSSNVVYGDPNWTQGTWQSMSIEAQAQANYITVFVRGQTEVVGGWQWIHMDDAQLAQLDAGDTPTPTLTATHTPSPSPSATPSATPTPITTGIPQPAAWLSVF